MIFDIGPGRSRHVPPPDASLRATDRDLSGWPGLTDHERRVILALPRLAYHLWHYLAVRVGQGVCRKCLNLAMQSAGTGSDQLAAQVRELRVAGFSIPKDTPKISCPTHGKQTQDLLTAVAPQPMASRLRWPYTAAELASIRKTLGGFDAFDGDRAGKLEVDHRVPMLRADADEERVDPDDKDAVRSAFQLLTPQHNLLKSRACEACVATNVRPPFLGMPSAVNGRSEYSDAEGCGPCAWAHPERWKAGVALQIQRRPAE